MNEKTKILVACVIGCTPALISKLSECEGVDVVLVAEEETPFPNASPLIFQPTETFEHTVDPIFEVVAWECAQDKGHPVTAQCEARKPAYKPGGV